MTRGNQREIDRERARKRNAEKTAGNKRDQKSDFFKNKDNHAQIMRLKQKKFEDQQNGGGQETHQKKQKYYKEEDD